MSHVCRVHRLPSGIWEAVCECGWSTGEADEDHAVRSSLVHRASNGESITSGGVEHQVGVAFRPGPQRWLAVCRCGWGQDWPTEDDARRDANQHLRTVAMNSGGMVAGSRVGHEMFTRRTQAGLFNVGCSCGWTGTYFTRQEAKEGTQKHMAANPPPMRAKSMIVHTPEATPHMGRYVARCSCGWTSRGRFGTETAAKTRVQREHIDALSNSIQATSATFSPDKLADLMKQYSASMQLSAEQAKLLADSFKTMYPNLGKFMTREEEKVEMLPSGRMYLVCCQLCLTAGRVRVQERSPIRRRPSKTTCPLCKREVPVHEALEVVWGSTDYDGVVAPPPIKGGSGRPIRLGNGVIETFHDASDSSTSVTLYKDLDAWNNREPTRIEVVKDEWKASSDTVGPPKRVQLIAELLSE